MLFAIDENSKSLVTVSSKWDPKELDIEKYLIKSTDEGSTILSEEVFGEPLLLLSNQVATRKKKFADILALDRYGNGVVIELKRNKGRLGVETQALQYLADFSAYTGESFINRFSKKFNIDEGTILGFVGDNVEIENINKKSRVILLARSFDESVYSLGEWLSSKDVAFRCVNYFPVEIMGKKLISFSVSFDRSVTNLYPLSFSSNMREPGVYWHNIANACNEWWALLIKEKQIPACFDDKPGDHGETILNRYIPGDTIVAYAKGFGAVGYGVIPNPSKYRLLPVGAKGDILGGKCRHRLKVEWKAVTSDLQNGLRPDEIRDAFGIYHPVSTSVSIDPVKAKGMLKRMNEQFN